MIGAFGNHGLRIGMSKIARGADRALFQHPAMQDRLLPDRRGDDQRARRSVCTRRFFSSPARRPLRPA